MRAVIVALVTLFASAISAMPRPAGDAAQNCVITAEDVNNPKNGQVVSCCDDKTDLGLMACFADGLGFTDCTHRGNIFRPCGTGTSCTDDGDKVNCI